MKTFSLMALLFSLALLGLGMTIYRHPGLQTSGVTNLTKSVELISVTPVDKQYQVELRNASTKNIDGYSLGFGDAKTVTTDLTAGSRLIGPGDHFTEVLPQATKLVIRYVIFDDGSSDGEAAATAELQDRREGIRAQLERIAPLLSAAAASSNVEQLKAQLQTLTEEAPAGRSVYVTVGMRNAIEDTRLSIEKLDKSNVSVSLARLIEQHNKRMMRLTTRVSR